MERAPPAQHAAQGIMESKNEAKPALDLWKAKTKGVQTALQSDIQNAISFTIPQQEYPHTLDHVDCPACTRLGRALMSTDTNLATLTFSEAFPLWHETRRRHIKARTFENNLGYAAALTVFFGRLPLKKINPGHLRTYQSMRETNHADQWRRPVGPSAINHELYLLSQILKRANLWKKLKDHYEPLKLPSVTPKRVMDYDEEQAFSQYVPETEGELLAYLVATITNNTSASGIELRGLRLRDVHIYGEHAEVRIPDDSVKNEYRARRVPLNRTARSAFEQCVIRAGKLGSFAPEHYLFPFRLVRPSRTFPHGQYDPNRPASRSWLAKSWGHLRKGTNMPGIRPHDLRHQFITRALEKGADEKHLVEITGHITARMLKTYSHIRMESKRNVVDMLDSHAPLRRRRA